MKTAFVTGGAGFLGINLIEQLIVDGWKVTAFDLNTARVDHFKKRDVKLIQGDITNADECRRAMPEKVDAVFHLAGDTTHWKLGDERQTKTNVQGTRNVVNAALKCNAGRLIATSSIGAYLIRTESPKTPLPTLSVPELTIGVQNILVSSKSSPG